MFLRVEFSFKTDSGYPKDTGVNLATEGIPFAMTKESPSLWHPSISSTVTSLRPRPFQGTHKKKPAHISLLYNHCLSDSATLGAITTAATRGGHGRHSRGGGGPVRGFWFLVCYPATQLATQLRQRCIKWCAVIRKPGSAWPNRTALPQWTSDQWMLYWRVLFLCFVMIVVLK